jgi:hypothetical protein
MCGIEENQWIPVLTEELDSLLGKNYIFRFNVAHSCVSLILKILWKISLGWIRKFLNIVLSVSVCA